MDTNVPTKIVKTSVLSRLEKIRLTSLMSLGVVATIFFGRFWFSSSHIPSNFSGQQHIFDYLLFFALSYVVWHQIVNEVFIWYISLGMKDVERMLPASGWRVTFQTAFVPGKEPYDVLEKTLKAMVEADYPHDTWVLDEGDDDIAKAICAKYGVKHFSRKGIPRYNQESGPFKAKTKAGNYNAWYDNYAAHYDFVAQLDVDFVPNKDFLLKTLGYFKDPEVAFVGTPQIYGNQHESWIARGAAEQAFNFYGNIQRGLFGHDMVLFIGANHVIRVAAHDNIEGYSGHIVEDHLTGMRFYAKRWKSVYIPEILAVGEGPATWGAYFSQQMRWAFGLIHILFTQSPRLFLKMRWRHALHYFLLQQYYFDGVAQSFGVILLCLFFFFGLQSTQMNVSQWLLYYFPVIAYQQMIFMALQKYYIDPKKESGFLLIGKFLKISAWPVYMLAFVSVLVGRRLAYKVTPKGRAQKSDVKPTLFIPHFILGSLTLVAIIVSFFNHRQIPQLLFFAFINTAAMYYFIYNGLRERIKFTLEGIFSLKTEAPKLDYQNISVEPEFAKG